MTQPPKSKNVESVFERFEARQICVPVLWSYICKYEVSVVEQRKQRRLRVGKDARMRLSRILQA